MQIIVSSKKMKDCINWIGANVNSPEQRLIAGVTALATQPIIDYKNKNVDEDTRMISVARTLAKIIAGTIVGVIVRKGAIAAANKYSGCKAEVDGLTDIIKELKPKKGSLFSPVTKKIQEKVVGKMTQKEFNELWQNYVKALGTFIATGAMVFTNFAIDAPLTRLLTRQFHKHITKKPISKDNQKENKKTEGNLVSLLANQTKENNPKTAGGKS